MKTRMLITAFVLLVPLTTHAQPIVTNYAYTLGGAGFDEGEDVGVDLAGNAYFIGNFRGTFDFDHGPGTAILSSVATDVYVASYGPTGDYRFAFRIGNALATSESAGGIAVDDAGNFYITGSQPFGSIDYDPDPAVTENRTGEFFIAGYDNAGGFRFAVTPVGLTGPSSGIGRAIALDGAGNVYVAGAFTGSIDFNPGSGVPVVLTSIGSTDIFVASYTTDGDFRFAFGIGGIDGDEGLGVAADASGNVFVTGRYSDTVSFDPSDTDGDGDTEDRTADVDGELYIAGYSPAGVFRFVHTLGDVGSRGYSIATDAADNLYVAGVFGGTYAFDPEDSDGDGDFEERTGHGNGSAFIAGYTSAGEFRFVSVPEGGSSLARDITVDASGISFLTGTFAGAVDFDAGGGTSSFSSDSGTDAFVVSYDENGAYRGGFSFGGDGLNTGRGIAIDPLGSTAVTGEFTHTTDFDPNAGSTLEATAAGQNDSFLGFYSYAPISLSAPAPPPSGCPAGLFISDFDSDQGTIGNARDDTGEFVAIEHVNDEPVTLDDCALVFFDGKNDESYFAMQLAGNLDAGGVHLVGNPSVADVDQTFADATLQNGPDAIALLDRVASTVPNGTPVMDVLGDVVAAVVYISDGNIFGQVPAPAKRAADLPALLKSAALTSAAGSRSVPDAFKLEANYPNPFNPLTVIPFSLAEDAHVTLDVFDATGRRVTTLIDRAMQAGVHELEWNGRSLSGEAMSSGIYVYRLRAGRVTHSRSMLLMK